MYRLQTFFYGLSLQAILEVTVGELERKLKIFGSEYGANLDVPSLPLEVFRFWKLPLKNPEVERDMTMMTISSATE